MAKHMNKSNKAKQCKIFLSREMVGRDLNGDSQFRVSGTVSQMQCKRSRSVVAFLFARTFCDPQTVRTRIPYWDRCYCFFSMFLPGSILDGQRRLDHAPSSNIMPKKRHKMAFGMGFHHGICCTENVRMMADGHVHLSGYHYEHLASFIIQCLCTTTYRVPIG